MGKLFFSRLSLIVVLILVVNVSAQEPKSYCVFKALGSPMLSDSIVLKKGMFIKPNHFLVLNEEDELVLTDNEGVLYEIKKKVTMPFNRISHYTKKEEQSSFTLNYLKYVWKKLWEKDKKENVGVVFRANKSTLLLTPKDGIKWFGDYLSFRWLEASSEEVQYLYLKNLQNGQLVKIGTNGDKLVIPVDGLYLKPDNSYSWSVSINENDDLALLEFATFEILSHTSFAEKIEEYQEVFKEFRLLGFSEEEIKKSFCEDRNLCNTQIH